jgi:hypothetical protein
MDPAASVHQIFVQISENVWWIRWQWLDKDSQKKAWAYVGVWMENSKLTEPEKGEEQSQEHAHYFH